MAVLIDITVRNIHSSYSSSRTTASNFSRSSVRPSLYSSLSKFCMFFQRFDPKEKINISFSCGIIKNKNQERTGKKRKRRRKKEREGEKRKERRKKRRKCCSYQNIAQEFFIDSQGLWPSISPSALHLVLSICLLCFFPITHYSLFLLFLNGVERNAFRGQVAVI